MMYQHIEHPKLLLPDAMVDGSDGESKADQAVLIDEGLIRGVGDVEAVRKDCPHGTVDVDLSGATLCPGLIDGHTHLSLAGDGRNYDEMFSETDEMMVMTGAMNMMKHLRAGINGEEEIRKSVRRLIHEGADYIKIMASGGGTRGTVPGKASYTEEELHAAVHEAHHYDRTTAAHCRASQSMKRAVQAGIDLIEHAEFLDPDDEMRFDPEIAAMMEESRIWISPALQAWTKYPRIVALRNQRDLGSLSHDGEQELDALERRARSDSM